MLYPAVCTVIIYHVISFWNSVHTATEKQKLSGVFTLSYAKKSLSMSGDCGGGNDSFVIY